MSESRRIPLHKDDYSWIENDDIDQKVFCGVCGDTIEYGEDYIELPDNRFAHYDCIDSIRQLLDWLKINVKMMED